MMNLALLKTTTTTTTITTTLHYCYLDETRVDNLHRAVYPLASVIASQAAVLAFPFFFVLYVLYSLWFRVKKL